VRHHTAITNGRILIVGGGRAGVAAAEELLYQGFRGEVTILGAERDPPYDRPQCSKKILTGHARPRDVRLPVRAGMNVRWLLGRRAIGVDPISRVVYTDVGEELRYEGLVVATGARPAPPATWPIGEPGLHVLHTLDDAWRLRKSLRDASRVAIIGAGLTGCEAAFAVRSLARDCLLIDSKPQVMTHALGELVGAIVTDEVRREGVSLRLGRRVRQLNRCQRGWLLLLDDGEEIWADLVVATTGEKPNTQWLADAGLDVSDGLLCDESLRVVGADGIVAAGTVARWPNLRYGPRPRRCGQWIAALEQGHAAAQTLLHGGGWAPPVTILPRFWSEQFGMRIQVCGDQPTTAEVTVTEMRPRRRDIARAGMLVSYTVDSRLVGVVAVNAPQAFTTTTHALSAEVPLVEKQPVRSANPAVRLRRPRRLRAA
jgi:NADPH-dependent 2,4-dienoyl-CoA reductase/sulfur reductase-like enzyme